MAILDSGQSSFSFVLTSPENPPKNTENKKAERGGTKVLEKKTVLDFEVYMDRWSEL